MPSREEQKTLSREEQQLLAELLRQSGLTARYLTTGAAGLGAAFANPIAYGLNEALEAADSDYRFPEQYGAFSDLLTNMGFPEPETPIEKGVGFASELGVPDPSDAPKVLAGITRMIDPSLAHLIPVTAAIRNLEKTNPERALGLEESYIRAQSLLDEGASPSTIASDTGLQAVPIGGERIELFYRPDRDSADIADLERLRSMATTPNASYKLRELYDNPDLFAASPEIADLPVMMTMSQRSAPIEALTSEMGGYKGGSYNPEHRAIDLPVYPPFREEELTPEVIIEALIRHGPSVLGESPAELLQRLHGIDDELPFKQKHGIVHETEHGLQHQYDLPRGSNPYEAGVISHFDENPILNENNEQFFFPDPVLRRVQRAIAESDYASDDITDAAGSFTAFDQGMARQKDEFAEELQRVIDEGMSPEERRLAEFTMEKMQLAIDHTRNDLRNELEQFKSALSSRHLSKRKEEEVLNRAFPKIKQVVIGRNIDRVTDSVQLYQRFWGEAAAEAAAYHVAEGADIPVVADVMTELGAIYKPSLLKVRNYLTPEQYASQSNEEFIRQTIDPEKINYQQLIENLLQE